MFIHDNLVLPCPSRCVYRQENNILKRGEEIPQQDHPFLIPICALAPTVPRTLVRGVGWRCYPDEAGAEDVDGAEDNSGSDSDVD